MSQNEVTRAVIPVAGFGTRMLPASKAIPKEMLPVVDKPAIQYVIEEAAAAGITEIILITHPSKKAIEDHFDTQAELEAALIAKQKTRLLEEVRGTLPKGVRLVMLRQGEARGLGHAVATAAAVIGDAPFAVLLPDVLLDQTTQTHDMSAMLAAFSATGRAQIMVEAVAAERVDQYGIVSLKGALEQPGFGAEIEAIVEKPPVADAPSNLAVVGRYVFPAAIMPLLATTAPGKGGEIQLTDAIATLLKDGVDAWRMTGSTFDCGSKAGYLEAILHFACKHPQLKDSTQALLSRFAQEGVI